MEQHELLQEIRAFLQKGRSPKVKELVQQAVDSGIPPKAILEEGLLAGMDVVGEKFKNNEVFVPEVLVAARASALLHRIIVSAHNPRRKT